MTHQPCILLELIIASRPQSALYRVVATTLPGLLQDFRPNLVIYDAGIDPHVDDALGRLALTDDGLRRRDLLVSCWF